MADILSVSQLNRYVKSLLDGDPLLKDLLLRGEISNFVCHQRSGHCYFTLKEGDCAVRAVMFSRYANDLLFEPENGMAVILRGAVSLYERDGSYQLYVYDMQPDGRGALQVAFEQLYRKLDRQGLFSQQNKQPIPTDARRIGVVTSASGAAFWDIVNVLSRRCPLATLVFCPAQVQGEAAAQSMVQALDALEQQGNCDVIILGRGGGSMEDLWCFNDEQLVKRVARCTVPLISAVGHETDLPCVTMRQTCAHPPRRQRQSWQRPTCPTCPNSCKIMHSASWQQASECCLLKQGRFWSNRSALPAFLHKKGCGRMKKNYKILQIRYNYP